MPQTDLAQRKSGKELRGGPQQIVSSGGAGGDNSTAGADNGNADPA